MYSAFVESDYSLSQYGRFLRILLEDHDRAVLWHCSVGKDRAGIGALLVQKILGVSDKDVIEDYLSTNDYVQDGFRKVSALVHRKFGSDDPAIDKSMEFFFFANKSYIGEFFDSVDRRFGSFDAFVRDGLGLSDKDVTLLRHKYLSRS
jgi:protein-tyrosine phosphatase